MKPATLDVSTDLGGAPGPARALLVLGFLLYAAVAGAAWWLALRLVPAELSLTLAGHTLHTASAHDHLNNVFLVFLLLPTMLGVEAATVGWRDSSLRQLIFARTPSLNTDLAVFVLGQGHVLDVVGRVMMLGASMISGAWIHEAIANATGVRLRPPPLPFALQLPLYFAIYTFFDYWTHRIDHTKFMWPLHRYHHSAEDFGVVTSVRQHPATFTAIFVVNLPLAVLGAPADVMIYVNVLVVAIGFLIHSKIEADWGFVGRWLVQSPNHHRAHHKLDMSRPTGHFAIAPIWDRLFGTWYEDRPDPKLTIGVDTSYRHGVFVPRDMLRDYYHFWIGWFGGRNDGPNAARFFEKR
ncbi:sterol desaturase family protein [uncultured Caulobacter sp.]|uniref:sterol desaturase family protein n=1 Tax=uncultured Caulobacter sp. TaxID=158749 RepID=UPI00260DEE96|nr:sterol desaturase family protein [uncultured Caulobacter sp.]